MVNTALSQLQLQASSASGEVPLLSESGELVDQKTTIEGVVKSKRRALVIVSSLIVCVAVISAVISFLAFFQSVSSGKGGHGGSSGSSNHNVPALKSGDPNRPQYHVMPQTGWLNDPNGLIYIDGVYHTFFQYNPYSSHWNWSIHWGHATSTDLVHWTRMPPALKPSSDGADCGGCWSGSMTLSQTGIPTILYTGVAQDDSSCQVPQAQRNFEYNPQEGYRETIMWAQPNILSNDQTLNSWPHTGISMSGPPENQRFNGWRDPFVYKKPGLAGLDRDYLILVGTGRMTEDMKTNLGGAVMAYTTSDLTDQSQWQYQGFMLEGDDQDAIMWECPWMVEITPEVGNSPHAHVLAVGGSLWDKTHPLEPLNPVIYWLGNFSESSYKFDKGDGDYRYLDLGETFYASNRMIDGDGRVLIWGWLRECMSSTDKDCSQHDYAGSLSMPRVLKVEGDILKQEVPAEMKLLRNQHIFENQEQIVEAEDDLVLFFGQYYHYEFHITMESGGGWISGILLQRVGFSMLLTYNWQTQEFRAFKDTADNLMTINPAEHHRGVDNFGGLLQNMDNQRQLTLQIFVDGSSVEVFTSSGQVISLRLYYDESIAAPVETLKLISYGGQTIFSEGSAWTLNSYWDHPQHQQIKNRALKSFPY